MRKIMASIIKSPLKNSPILMKWQNLLKALWNPFIKAQMITILHINFSLLIPLSYPKLLKQGMILRTILLFLPLILLISTNRTNILWKVKAASRKLTIRRFLCIKIMLSKFTPSSKTNRDIELSSLRTLYF